MDHQAFAQLLGNYGEFISSVAVVGTLIYLAIQVRHSKELLEKNHAIALSQVQQSRANSGREQHLLLSDSTHLASLVAQESGIDEKTLRLRSYFGAFLVHVDNMVFQYELGLVDDESMAGVTNTIRRYFDRWVELDLNLSARVRNWRQQHSRM